MVETSRKIVTHFRGRKLVLAFLIFAGSALLIVTSAVAQTYTVTDLGTLGGGTSEAFGINNSGQVVGEATLPDGRWHAFLWQDGVMQDIHPVSPTFFSPLSTATAINSSGQVVGYWVSAGDGGEHNRAFLWQNGVTQDLGTLPQQAYSEAYTVNDLGQVVGSSGEKRPCRFDRHPPHAFLWQNGIMLDLGTLPASSSRCESFFPSSSANGINNSSQVAGSSDSDSGRHAFLWQNGVMQDLGTLPGGTSSSANGINDSSQVVGWSGYPDGSSRAFLWHDGLIQDLGVLSGHSSSTALGVNSAGQVVGSAGDFGFAWRAFLWQDGVMQDLNDLIPGDSGWTLTEAMAINNNGQMVGTGLHNGQTRAFLLDPVAPSEGRVEQDDLRITYTGIWYTNGYSRHSGGSAVLSMEAGGRAVFTFSGSSVRWIGYRDEWSGIANVYIDGVLQATVDTYGGGEVQAELFSAFGLSSGTHTIVVEVTGEKNEASGGSWVWVDAFNVSVSPDGPSPVVSGGRIEQDDPAIGYGGDWYSHSASLFSGGSAFLSMGMGAQASFSFSGTGVSWIGYRDEWSGIARVYLDGALVAEVDTYASSAEAQAVIYTVSGLAPGTHSLRVEVTGEKNPASGSSWVWVDAFEISP